MWEARRHGLRVWFPALARRALGCCIWGSEDSDKSILCVSLIFSLSLKEIHKVLLIKEAYEHPVDISVKFHYRRLGREAMNSTEQASKLLGPEEQRKLTRATGKHTGALGASAKL